MNNERKIWQSPREANLRLTAELPYVKQVHVFNDQTQEIIEVGGVGGIKYSQSYHLTIKVSSFRFFFRLGDTKYDVSQVCLEGMPYDIPYMYYIKTSLFGKWFNYQSKFGVLKK